MPCYLHTTAGAYITTFAFPGVDGIFIVTCSHIATQFWLLSRQFHRAFDRADAVADRNYRIGKRLIECIQDQRKLFDIVDDFVDAFAMITLIHFISTATVIGLASINLLIVIIHMH